MRNLSRQRPRDGDREIELTATSFNALSDVEKERIFEELDAESPEAQIARSTPLTPQQRARWKKAKRKMGRPRIGKGSAVISLSLEKDLLKQADAYAKAHHLKRSEFFAHAVRSVLRGSKTA